MLFVTEPKSNRLDAIVFVLISIDRVQRIKCLPIKVTVFFKYDNLK